MAFSRFLASASFAVALEGITDTTATASATADAVIAAHPAAFRMTFVIECLPWYVLGLSRQVARSSPSRAGASIQTVFLVVLRPLQGGLDGKPRLGQLIDPYPR